MLKDAALTCAACTKHFEDGANEGLALLTAMLQKSSINTNAKKPNTMPAEMRRACVAREINISSEELSIIMTCQ